MTRLSRDTVIHQAGPWLQEEQRCSTCGLLLRATNHPDPGSRVPWPEGALIEHARTFHAMTLTAERPTCKGVDHAPTAFSVRSDV